MIRQSCNRLSLMNCDCDCDSAILNPGEQAEDFSSRGSSQNHLFESRVFVQAQPREASQAEAPLSSSSTEQSEERRRDCRRF